MEKQVKFESKIAKLYEVKTSMSKAKEDVEKALVQQDTLINIIESSPDKDKISEGYLDALKADRNVLAAKALTFADSLTAVELLLHNYEDEKKNNKKHSALTTDAVVTLLINTFDIFRETEKTYLEKLRALNEKPAENETTPSEEVAE